MTFVQKSIILEISDQIHNNMAEDKNVRRSTSTTIEEEKKLVLSYENLTQFPLPNLIEQNGISDLEVLDLSHNRLTDVNFLIHFPNLTTLILDHNLLTSEISFPTSLKNLTTLWINHNHIDKLHPFIQRVNKAFPNLKYLSLMGNIGAPSYLNGGTYYQYLQYRLFVISQIKNLVCLDDLHVTIDQRDEAHRLFKRSYFQTLISLPFPQYLHHVQQRVKLYLREPRTQNCTRPPPQTFEMSSRRVSEESGRRSSSSSSHTTRTNDDL